MHPLVTIVTATRNRRELLRRLMQSVIAQSYPNIEHVVVDGLSNDGTQDLLREYERKCNLRWISEKDRHQVEALNKGLKMAKGEFVTVTHDDDYWLPEGIVSLARCFENDPLTDIAYGDSWGEYANGERVKRTYRAYTMDDMVNRGYQIPQDGSLFRRVWLERVGFLNEKLEYVPEYELFLRIMQAGGRVQYEPVLTSVGGLHEGKKSWTGTERSWDETWRANRAHGGKLLSQFTLLYLKNRYLASPSAFIKKYFSGAYNWLKRVFRMPTY